MKPQPDIHSLTQLPGSPGCVVCDNNGSNSRSLHVRLYWDEENGQVCIPCEPDDTWCGFNEVVHGGMIASMLDEAMAWVVKMRLGDWAFTVDFHVRYKKAVAPGKTYWATAYVSSLEHRKIIAEADFTSEDGTVFAHATGIFLPPKGGAVAAPRTS
jgi:uncharacterized protein (TIGR00369 family)